MLPKRLALKAGEGADIADLFLSNDISTARARNLVSKELAGATGLSGLSVAGNSGKQPRNLNQDLRRKFLKGNLWPRPYMAQILCLEPSTLEEKHLPVLF